MSLSFNSVLQIAAPIVGGIFFGPIGAAAGAALAARTRGGGSWEDAVKAGAIAYGAAWAMGAYANSSGTGGEGFGSFDPGGEGIASGAMDGTITGASESMSVQFLGGSGGEVATSPNMLLADAGTTMTDVGAGLTQPGAGMPRAMLDPGGGTFQSTTTPSGAVESTVQGTPPPASTGLLNSFSDWHPAAQYGAVQGGVQGGLGLLQGVAAHQDNRDRMAHERELVDRRRDAEEELLEFRRRHAAAGGAGRAPVNLRPSADQVLRRPDGRPVHSPSGLLLS